MIELSQADVLIIAGIVTGALGLFAPQRVLQWQSLHVGTLVVTGAIIAFVGFGVKVVFG